MAIKATYNGPEDSLSPPVPTGEPARYLRLAAGKPTEVDEATATAIVSHPGLAKEIKVTDGRGKPWRPPAPDGDPAAKPAGKEADK